MSAAFPVGTGMIRNISVEAGGTESVPRRHGDDPEIADQKLKEELRSP